MSGLQAEFSLSRRGADGASFRLEAALLPPAAARWGKPAQNPLADAQN